MKTAVVISSCDLYSDCWIPMIYSFRKYWNDCPYPINIISNFEALDEEGITFIKVGEHKGFGSNMRRALQVIDAEIIILFLEDFFLADSVDNDMINNHIQYCYRRNISYLKIDSCDIIYRDSLRIGSSSYCVNPLDIRYSLNLSIAIWRKDVLMSLCVDGFSAWDFERKGINYIKKNKLKFYSETIHSSKMNKMTIKKISGPGAVTKGRWTIEGKEYLIGNGFHSVLLKRKVEPSFSRFLTSFYKPNSIFWWPIGLLLRIFQRLNINF